LIFFFIPTDEKLTENRDWKKESIQRYSIVSVCSMEEEKEKCEN